MPEYKYRCRSCGHTFDRVLAMDARHDVTCELCMGEVSIVPQRTGVLLPMHVFSDRAPLRSEVTEPSGLMVQGARDGW